MPGKRAKILSTADIGDLLIASCTRHRLRNAVIVLLSAKAGLRAGEIANLTWDMVVDGNGQVSGLIELADGAAKKCSGRAIPIASRPRCRSGGMAAGRTDIRVRHRIRARRPNEAAQHRRVVQPGFQEHWPERLLVAFRPPNVRHSGCSDRAQGRRLAAGRATAGRSPVDPDHTAVHRRRQRPEKITLRLGSYPRRQSSTLSGSFMRLAVSPGQQHGLTTFEPTSGLTKSKGQSGIATPLLCSIG
jgi:hypothetical protein